eukprot:TRINITY_DN1818_c0_g1_i1.p1 TRINITY_DN1818_c0_g1~~TRINITY_DN1818_c0_g1_i1.p1  ORF type:complete len:436 (-),score=85.24 TRINITY_DN1818_c0_g1_i1:49-1305(-)
MLGCIGSRLALSLAPRSPLLSTPTPPTPLSLTQAPRRHYAIVDRYVFPDDETELVKRKRERDELNRHKSSLVAIREKRRQMFKQMSQNESAPIEVVHPAFKPPVQPTEPRKLNVAIIGAPNAGKSTLVNRLVDRKVSIVTPKAQTTRVNTLGIVTRGDSQLVFMDTPGIVDRGVQRRVNRELVMAAWDSVYEADIVLLVVDAVKTIDYNFRNIMEKLKILVMEAGDRMPPIALLLNKADLVEELPVDGRHDPVARFQHHFPPLRMGFDFDYIYHTSGLTGKNVKEFKDFLFEQCKPGKWEFHQELHSNQSPLTMVEECLRERLYDRLNEEVPYLIVIRNTGWKLQPSGRLYIQQTLFVPSIGVLRMVHGVKSENLFAIQVEAEKEISVLMNRPINLSIEVKVRKDILREESQIINRAY